MTTEYIFEDDLSKIEVPPGVTLDKDTLAALQEHMKEQNGCTSLGPLTLCWKIQLPEITITVSVLGITLGTIVLNPTKPCQTLKVNAGIASGEIKLCIVGSCLKLSGKVCMFTNCAKWTDKTIFCW